MDRKLRNAYEKMTMPDSCSQRIEALLQEREKPRKQQKNQVVYRPKSRPRAWASAAALVCLAVMISLGGVFLFVETQKQQDSPRFLQPTESGTETRTNTEREEMGELSEEGKSFLLAMCYAMPDWENYYVLDDRFWQDFLFATFTCPEEVTGNRAKTIIGEVPCEDGAVLISREQAEAYATLTMGCDLPVLSLGGAEDSGGIRYYDGFYHIQMSDFGARGFTWQGLAAGDGEAYFALFDAYVDEEDNVVGSVRLKLRKADNKNGFIIVSKQSDMSFPTETMRVVEQQDKRAVFSCKANKFRQNVRETDFYTVHQYHLPWEAFMESAQTCTTGETWTHPEGKPDEWIVEPSRTYRLEKVRWVQQEEEEKTMTLTGEKDGEAVSITIRYVEDENGERTPVGSFYQDNPGWWMDSSSADRWWIAGEDAYSERDCKTLWRIDPDTEEMTDLWGNVPEEKRVYAVSMMVYGMEVFEDGSFLSAYLNENRERRLLYADTVQGLVYCLDALVGKELDDCIGLPNEEEILCWSDGEYWRINRDTMYPEYLGKLQEDVLFAPGISSGEEAFFSLGRTPGEEGSYRVYDYVENRFLTLEYRDDGQGEISTKVSPDGKKLLITKGASLLQVLDSEKGMLLSVNRTGWEGTDGRVQWLSEKEICFQDFDDPNCCIYTLK